MALLKLTLAEQNGELRSNRVSFLLTIENLSDQIVRIENLIPNLRPGLALETSPRRGSEARQLERHLEVLRADLEHLAADYLAEDRACRTTKRSRFASLLHSADRWSGRPFLSRGTGRPGHAGGLPPEMAPTIRDYEDAQRIAQHYFRTPPESAPSGEPSRTLTEHQQYLRRTYLLKLDQMQVAAAEWARRQSELPIALIQPHSDDSVLYVIRFTRGLLNSRAYGVSVDVQYVTFPSDVDSETFRSRPFTKAAETLQVISPQPWVMTLIAILGGLLGVVLRACTASYLPAVLAGTVPSATWTGLLDGIRTPPGLAVAPLLALIFFNIFEFTTFADRFKMGLGWRSALFIGVLCGISTERFLKALGGFLGP